jgi:hypothetical protein
MNALHSIIKARLQAKQEGLSAGRSGLRSTDNPYRRSDTPANARWLWMSWFSGWSEGYEDYAQRREDEEPPTPYRMPPLLSAAERSDMAAAHAHGLHADAPREFCPCCLYERRGQR